MMLQTFSFMANYTYVSLTRRFIKHLDPSFGQLVIFLFGIFISNLDFRFARLLNHALKLAETSGAWRNAHRASMAECE